MIEKMSNLKIKINDFYKALGKSSRDILSPMVNEHTMINISEENDVILGSLQAATITLALGYSIPAIASVFKYIRYKLVNLDTVTIRIGGDKYGGASRLSRNRRFKLLNEMIDEDDVENMALISKYFIIQQRPIAKADIELIYLLIKFKNLIVVTSDAHVKNGINEIVKKLNQDLNIDARIADRVISITPKTDEMKYQETSADLIVFDANMLFDTPPPFNEDFDIPTSKEKFKKFNLIYPNITTSVTGKKPQLAVSLGVFYECGETRISNYGMIIDEIEGSQEYLNKFFNDNRRYTSPIIENANRQNIQQVLSNRIRLKMNEWRENFPPIDVDKKKIITLNSLSRQISDLIPEFSNAPQITETGEISHSYHPKEDLINKEFRKVIVEMFRIYLNAPSQDDYGGAKKSLKFIRDSLENSQNRYKHATEKTNEDKTIRWDNFGKLSLFSDAVNPIINSGLYTKLSPEFRDRFILEPISRGKVGKVEKVWRDKSKNWQYFTWVTGIGIGALGLLSRGWRERIDENIFEN